ncbi:CHAT domain-containing protein [Steroidobacter flavus]|uniref:CHAT domain-containing protein n=1 Tax=Steroidobacter flavus TaxID=1842136 RepID=A0ABV8T5G4_9GAMM
MSSIEKLIGADTLSTQRSLLVAHAELLSAEFLESIGKLLRESVPPLSLVLRDRLALIKRCQEVGIAAAFAEIVASRSDAQVHDYLDDVIAGFVDCNGFDAKREYLAHHPELLTGATLRKLESRDGLAPEQQQQYHIAHYFMTLAHELGVDRLTTQTRDILLALEGLCGCTSGPDQQEFIEQHPLLLHADAEDIAAVFERTNVPDGYRRAFSALRALLASCRATGIAAAFAENFEARRARLFKRVSTATVGLMSPVTMEDLRRHLEDYPELRGDCSHPEVRFDSDPNDDLIRIIDGGIEDLASDKALSPRQRALLLRNATILRRARQIGIAEAIEEAVSDARRALPFEAAVALLSSTAVEVLNGRLSMPDAMTQIQGSNVVQVIRESGIGDIISVCLASIRDPHVHLTVAELLDASATHAALSIDKCAQAKTTLCGYLVEVVRLHPGVEVLQHRSLAFGREAAQLLSAASLPLPYTLASNLTAILIEAFKRSGASTVLNEAIETMQEAARLFPDEPAVLTNLGSALAIRYGSSGAMSDIDAAIAALRQAAASEKKMEPTERIGMLSALGSSLRKRASVRGESDLIEAEAIYEELSASVPPASPHAGLVLNNLSLVQRDRFHLNADPALIDAAASNMSQSVALAAPQSWEWINRASNLADILLTRYNAQHLASDLETCISLTRDVLELSPRTPLAISVLATALLKRFDATEDRSDLDAAIRVLMVVQTGDDELRGDEDIVRACMHVLHRRYELDRNPSVLEQAVDLSLMLLERQQAGSLQWAIQQAEIATLLELQYEASGSATDLNRCIEARRQALSVFTVERTPTYYARSANILADLLRNIPDWPAAREVGQRALEALQEVRRQRGFAGAADSESDLDLTLLCSNLTEACLKSEDSPERRREAMVYAEAGKARAFLDQMSTVDLLAPAGVPEDLLFRERDLRLRLRRLASASDNAADASYQSLRRRLEDILQAIDRYPGAQPYVAIRRGSTPEWKDLAELAGLLGERCAVVEYSMLLSGEMVAFVLRSGWEAPEVIRLPIHQLTLLNRYMRGFFRELHGQRHPSLNRNEWLGLGALLIAPLEATLQDVELVYFIPQLGLRYLPLHALTLGGEPFITRRAVAYAPSAGVLLRILRGERERAMHGAQSLVMSYTDGDAAEKELFDREAQVVADVLGALCVNGEFATESVLREHARTASIIHLSCHGRFDSEDPLSSAIKLHGGLFTARDWARLQVRSDLIVLSACETGLSGSGRGDDIAGMTSALLYSGAASVLLTLWRVNAHSTLEWMVKFYETLQALSSSGARSFAIARAFQTATLHVRERHPEVHHWGAFILQGDCQ